MRLTYMCSVHTLFGFERSADEPFELPIITADSEDELIQKDWHFVAHKYFHPEGKTVLVCPECYQKFMEWKYRHPILEVAYRTSSLFAPKE